MSVQQSTKDGVDYEANGNVEDPHEEFHEAADRVMALLGDRFKKHTRRNVMDSGYSKLILIPEHPVIDDGEYTKRLLTSVERVNLTAKGFEFSFSNGTSEGAGVKFWFKYDPDT